MQYQTRQGKHLHTYAVRTSPMAATPAGRDNTPDPTQPLIKLNVAMAIVSSFDFSALSSLPLSAVPEAAAFIRVLIPCPRSPPRGIDNVVIPGLSGVLSFAFGNAFVTVVAGAIAAVAVVGEPNKKASDNVVTSRMLGRIVTMAMAPWNE